MITLLRNDDTTRTSKAMNQLDEISEREVEARETVELQAQEIQKMLTQLNTGVRKNGKTYRSA